MAQGMIQQKFPCKHNFSTADVLNVDDNRDLYVFKKFINAAIYVEKTIDRAASSSQNYEMDLTEGIKIMKTKRCSCSIDPDGCAIHLTLGSGDGLKKANADPRPMRNKELLRKLEEIQHDNRIGKFKTPFTGMRKKSNVKQISFVDSLKKQNRKSQKKITLSKSSPVRGKELSNPEKQKTEIEIKNSSHSYSRSSEDEYKTLDLDFLSDASDNEKSSGNVSLKDEDTSHDESSSTLTTSTSSTSSQVTVRKSDKAFIGELKGSKGSLSSLTSFYPSENENIRQWLAKKSEQRRKIQTNNKMDEKRKKNKTEESLERERENFRRWLETKKKLEYEKKAKEDKDQNAEEFLKELEKEKKQLQNQVKYQVWLKRKEQAEMEKKREEELKRYQAKIDKEEKIAANERAFQNWLKASRDKPRPIPLNKGLDSLRSSLSVNFINPVPWVPNIDEKPRSK